jgi:hypothetical protein
MVDHGGGLQVEAMRRRDLFQRMSLLDKINESTDKARSLVEQRAALQEQRRTANMDASFQRQRLQAPPPPPPPPIIPPTLRLRPNLAGSG